MPVPFSTAPCTRHQVIARDVIEFTLSKPEGFSFQAGQFILFQVPLPGNPQDIQPRAFSIASAPEEDELLFIAKLKAGGRGSRWIAEDITRGTNVTFQGPFGAFLLDGKTTKRYLFIATGSGIAPFRSHIVSACLRGEKRPMDVLLAVRAEEDLFWMQEFQDISAKYPNVKLTPVLSQPSASWNGLKGRLQTVIPSVFPDLSATSVYICGNPEMTKEIKALSVAQWCAKKEDVHGEGYV